MLTDTDLAAMVKIFISYSHEDKEFCDEIKNYLNQLVQCGHSIDVWADHEIKAGEDWDEAIEENLNKSDIILFLLSVNFINSGYIKDNELAVGYERRQGGSAVIIPVLVSACMWEKTGLAKFQALPIDSSNKRAKYISDWGKDERATVYQSIADAIAEKASVIINNKQVLEKEISDKLQRYRELCQEFLSKSPDLKLSRSHKDCLQDLRNALKISVADAEKAFEEVQEPFRMCKENRERYLNTVKAYLLDRVDLSAEQTKGELKDRQRYLNLEDGDISALQPEIDRLIEEQRAKEEEDRKAREEEAERNAEAERLAEEQRAKEEEDRKAREEEAERNAEAERLAEEQRAKEEEDRKAREEEAERNAEAERLAEEQRAKEEEDRKAREEEAERNAEAERLAEEQRAKEEEDRKAREEEAKRQGKAERLASEDLIREQQARDQALQQVPKQAQNQQPDLQTLSISSAVLVQEESRGLKRLLGPSWRIDRGLVQAKVYQQPLAKALEITMVQIPAGSFQMGSPATEAERSEDEGPQRRVQLQSFFLGQTPVTQAQWQEVASWPQVDMKLNPDPANCKGANRPVEQVNWGEAMEFCRRLSRRTKLSYTLPSEAQWEYACRAGTTSPFAFGDTLTTDLANYDGNYNYGSGPKGQYREKTTEVGSFAANAWGLQDMHGNVMEWCLDHWHGDYRGAPSDGSAWVDRGESDPRLLRGGSWFLNPRHCRSADRDWGLQDFRLSLVGCRLCRFPPGLIS